VSSQYCSIVSGLDELPGGCAATGQVKEVNGEQPLRDRVDAADTEAPFYTRDLSRRHCCCGVLVLDSECGRFRRGIQSSERWGLGRFGVYRRGSLACIPGDCAGGAGATAP